ncbi:VOC family protein [Protaetiibacter sp. SSC-01]|uniref:glyoxalase superfamily protein n=1 Tax=Protaetiibacter sp. SSC-01 TaxID=2759943 RepID=UPI001656DCA0|nr:glyoxalase superfamily protein [Protaetiibacter sp. SSC-01]QNO38167.1 VOC family protein [Protaetiibacter sp. SSC-01]
MDYRIELVGVPVSDADRSKAFYGDQLGWPVDHDVVVNENLRFIQVTPPGSACSIAFGVGLGDMEPGSLRALQVVVSNADEALADLRARGVEAQGVDEQPWGRFVYFADPDGNTWSVQELPKRDDAA